MQFKGKNGESIELINITNDNLHLINESKPSELSLLWFKSDVNKFKVDSVHYELKANKLISFTEFHSLKTCDISDAVLIRWNRSFYCVVDHDSEVGCKGILFYGASNLPIIEPSNEETDILNTVYRMLLIEMKSHDSLQLEMLQMMLKRLLILCTRIYKNTNKFSQLSEKNIDIIREFNFLVEQHFKSKHTVKEYAELLHKSPKTLSNLFKKHAEHSPIKYIHKRIMIEARRLLTHSDLTISEIGMELGFSDIQTFSRFFKKQENISPQSYRKGKNAKG